MALHRTIVLAIISLEFLQVSCIYAQDIVTYTTPRGVPESDRFQVSVRSAGNKNWQHVSVQTAKVNVRNANKSGKCSFANFDASYAKPVEVRVTAKYGNFDAATIRPENNNITFTKNAKAIRFTLGKPQKISIEVGNDRLNNLFLFANELETNVPDKNDPNIIFLGPGLHKASDVKVKSGQTVYLHGGAQVQGSINIYDKDNVTIKGRGVLNGELLNHDRSKTRPNLLKFKNGKNIRIDGITLIDSPVWSLFIDKCEKVAINNVKVISYMVNGDGITLSQSQNVNVTNAFVRTADDNISVKSMNGGACSDINIKNSILWADDAHNMLIGPESNGASYQNIRFTDITVLENTQRTGTYSGVMSVMASDRANISGIYWDRITIADITAGEIIRLAYTKVHSVEKDNYGTVIRNIHFSNIDYNGRNATPGTIRGVDGARIVSNVTIKNFMFNNELVQAAPIPNKTDALLLRSSQNSAPQISINNFVEKVTIME
ncbi:hypothetical protein DYBT9623_03950 [Dyadobacter sp. CECT 9623]|uniref:Glycosyl hydrolases family 28 n=1 Tax=Dyadobacter linearis TaxID=2823330 RepID=A0ABM8UUE3_9BACT|nr:glycosyl hydrolase family 28 protein [Dyadobacter sp. CECT 9623]CAG5072010.1 hypothetical protein DYBT9623_03950 [Dyadobacter sp. CECT 9623]